MKQSRNSGVTNCRSSNLGGGGRRRKLVERGILVVLIIAVIVAIFAPVGVLIKELLNIEGGSGGSFTYKESCSNNTVERVSNYIDIVIAVYS